MTLRVFSPILCVSLLASAACFLPAPAPEAAPEAGSDETSAAGSSSIAPAGGFAASTLLVTTANVNFRKAPAIAKNVIDVLAKGTEVTALGGPAQNGFYAVSYEGTHGFISGKYLALEGDSAPGVDAGPTEPAVEAGPSQTDSAPPVVTSKGPPTPPKGQRVRVAVGTAGSIQNPSFSPDTGAILFTSFSAGYNNGTATLHIASLSGGSTTALVDVTAESVNLPGCWTQRLIPYSSDRGGGLDQVYLIASDDGLGATSTLVPTPTMRAWEPTLSPDGQWVVFESHDQSGDNPGSIWKVKVDGTSLTRLTPSGVDAKEPNWSPTGALILYQAVTGGGSNDIFTMDTNGHGVVNVTNDSSTDDTDASWSPDGSRIVYSTDLGGDGIANIYVIPAGGGTPVRVTSGPQYDGAPSWSADGRLIAFETAPGDPDNGGSTTIMYVAAP